MKLSADVLNIDIDSEISRISDFIRFVISQELHKRGAVVAVSGGIDSAVSAALCAKALGKERVSVLFLPEKDSSPASLRLGKEVATALGLQTITEEITSTLEGAGCYRRRVDAIRKVFPEFEEGWKDKLSLPSIIDRDRLNLTRLTIQAPTGETKSARMPVDAYLQLVAATNFKQRIRTMMTYYHADRLNYAVCGTPNRLEFDQGFFVKVGDGSADFKPIAHLYKSQVYMLARELGIPDEICNRPPTSDTFSLAQTQEEFYFALPYDKMDLCLYGLNNRVSPEDLAPLVGLTAEQVQRVFTDIQMKRRSTRYLHLPPLISADIEGVAESVAGTAMASEGD